MAIRICILQEADFSAAAWTNVTTKALALRDLSNAQVVRVQVVYPGTALQTAQAVMADIVAMLRAKARNNGGDAQRALDQAVMTANQGTFATGFDADFPA